MLQCMKAYDTCYTNIIDMVRLTFSALSTSLPYHTAAGDGS
jgi:hypothetical protein